MPGTEAITPAEAITKIVDEVAKPGGRLGEDAVSKIVRELSRLFSVKTNEVAWLELDSDGAALNFLYPSALRNVGNIPISTANSLAVRTVRERRPEMINNFTAQKHPTVFESVNLDPASKERHPIQKIMSAPLLVDGKARGVLQVSRKGKTPSTAGADFGIRDLTALVSISSIIARCFKK